jgi:hypothetical protein
VRLDALCSLRCIFPALRCITLPEPVILNRFLAPECVFIFGMAADLLAVDALAS